MRLGGWRRSLSRATLALLALAPTGPASAGGGPLFGLTPFPYDATPEALERTARIVEESSTLAALHLDNGVPWEELLADSPLPAPVRAEWDGWAARIPPGRPVYVGLAPLAKDRKSLAPGYQGRPLPRALQGVRLDDAQVKRAYLAYARRVVERFRPTFLNLGIEAGEILSRDASRWPQFEALYDHVRAELKREYPEMRVGISFGLQGLLDPAHGARAQALVERSDYLCVSFYPHLSRFNEAFGDPPLKPGRDAWVGPLEFLRRYTRKPLAVCETGLGTRDVEMKQYKLSMKGYSPEMQAQYVHDLVDVARRDGYLFVVWFLAVDYDRLLEKIPRDDANLMWRDTGLYDGNVRPKPALQEWMRGVRGTGPGASAGAPPQGAAREAPSVRAEPGSVRLLGTADPSDLPRCGPGSVASATREGPGPGAGAMRWEVTYRGKEWMYCQRELAPGSLAGATTLHLWARSDRDGPMLLQLEERSGETFFVQVDLTSTWSRVEVELRSLRPDPAKRKNGTLEAADLKALLVADPLGTAGFQGRRTIWLSDVGVQASPPPR